MIAAFHSRSSRSTARRLTCTPPSCRSLTQRSVLQCLSLCWFTWCVEVSFVHGGSAWRRQQAMKTNWTDAIKKDLLVRTSTHLWTYSPACTDFDSPVDLPTWTHWKKSLSFILLILLVVFCNNRITDAVNRRRYKAEGYSLALRYSTRG